MTKVDIYKFLAAQGVYIEADDEKIPVIQLIVPGKSEKEDIHVCFATFDAAFGLAIDLSRVLFSFVEREKSDPAFREHLKKRMDNFSACSCEKCQKSLLMLGTILMAHGLVDLGSLPSEPSGTVH